MLRLAFSDRVAINTELDLRGIKLELKRWSLGRRLCVGRLWWLLRREQGDLLTQKVLSTTAEGEEEGMKGF